MVINETALVREMKEAYKGGGYAVVARETGRTAIVGPCWAAELERENLHREVLSLMALHMGFLPKTGEAYRVMKANKEADVQHMLYETGMMLLQSLEAPVEAASGEPVKIKKTPLTLEGSNVWQKTGNRGLVLIDPKHESILLQKEETVLAGDFLYREGSASRVWIGRVKAEKWMHQLAHLAEILWVG